jgi:hypothetical protein
MHKAKIVGAVWMGIFTGPDRYFLPTNNNKRITILLYYI